MAARAKKQAITLEVYDHFHRNPCDGDSALSIDQLNQVILMHGFEKIHRRRKGVLVDALSAVDLVKPERSTLHDKLSPCDSLPSLDEVKLDMETLNWQECKVQSIETAGYGLLLQSEGGGGGAASGDLGGPSLPFKFSRKRRTSVRKRRRRSMTDSGSGAVADVDSVGGAAAAASASTLLASYDLLDSYYSWGY